ncbi:histidine utilization repressor [uncultured Desulfuromusa sp.]|uniref:histidine utilization repressor n=1 Tax=uncultured Desulfuromusa sp. TaxID=219183 RepID=UPI002AA6EB4F|nr:histidine utilization repressor [uncultured Desulfuromusa sp.]
MKISRHVGVQPRFQVIKDFIAQAIKDRTYLPDAQIPTEHELAKQFSVSRMTANRAVKELVSEGKLVRYQGLGTFVATVQAESPLLEIRSIAAEIRGRNNVYSNDRYRLKAIKATQDLAGQLGINTGDKVYHSLIVHKENGQPLQFAERYVNAAIVPDYIHQDFSVTTPSQYLSELFPLSEIEHIVEAVLPTSLEQDALKITAATPCLLVKRRTWSGNNLISYARLVHPGNLYRLSSRSEV